MARKLGSQSEGTGMLWSHLQTTAPLHSPIFPDLVPRGTKGLFLSAFVLSCLSQSDRRRWPPAGRKACTVPGLKLGTHPWIAPQRVPEEAGSRHHLPHVYQPVAHSLQVELSASLPHVPSLLVLPRPEGRAQSPHSASPPQDIPRLGVFL